MTLPEAGDSWQTKEFREAEAALDSSLARAEELEKEIDALEIPDADRTARPEDINAIKAAAENPSAGKEMRELKKKVDAGGLTWKDVLEGRAYSDPEVRAAMTAKLSELRDVYQEFQDGSTLDDVLEAARDTEDPFGGYDSAPPAAPPPPTRTQPVADDDYFTDPLADDQLARGAPKPKAPRPAARSNDDDYFDGPLF